MKSFFLAALIFLGAMPEVFSQATTPASDDVVIVGNSAQPFMPNKRGTIQEAINKAGTSGVVIVPGVYPGQEALGTLSNPNNVLIIDLRGGTFKTFPAISGGGGGTCSSGNPGQIVFSDTGGVCAGAVSLQWNKNTQTLQFPDFSTWGAFGLSAAAGSLIPLDGTYGAAHQTGFVLANSAGTISLAPNLTPGLSGGGYIAMGGHTAAGASRDLAELVSYNGSGGDVQLSAQINSLADTLNYTYSGGGLVVLNESGVNGSMFGLDRVNKSAHFFGAVYFPNAAGTGASAGLPGSIPVSQGPGLPMIHSSDQTGPFQLLGNFGTCTRTPSGLQNGLCFGPGNFAQAWDVNSNTFQNIVLANNVPASGIVGQIPPGSIDTSNTTGLGTLFQLLGCAAQFNIPEINSSGGCATGPFNDSAANLVSTTKLLDLATFALNRDFSNCTPTGTTVNKLAKTSASGVNTCATITSHLDTQGEIGVCTALCGTTGTAAIAKIGQNSLVIDNATTVNDWIIQSTTVDGDGHDTGSTACPGSGQVIGRVLSTNAGTGTYNVDFGGCDVAGGGGGGGSVTSVTFTGDGTVLSNTPSTAVTTTGTLTAALASAGAGTVLANPTGSPAAPSYTATPVLGTAGSVVGTQGYHNATSGILTTAPPTGALGTVTNTYQAVSDTFVYKATTDTLTNKNLLDATNSVNLGCAASGPQSAIVGNGSAQNVYSCTIPGGTLGTNKCLHAHVGWQHTTGSASVSYNFTYGGTGFSAGSSALTAAGEADFYMCANAATNAQYGSIGPAAIGTTVVSFGNGTAAIDDTVNQTLAFTFTVAATDNVTPKIWVVDLVH